MENIIGAILWEIEGGEQGAMDVKLRQLLGDNDDLIPNELSDCLI